MRVVAFVKFSGFAPFNWPSVVESFLNAQGISYSVFSYGKRSLTFDCEDSSVVELLCNRFRYLSVEVTKG